MKKDTYRYIYILLLLVALINPIYISAHADDNSSGIESIPDLPTVPYGYGESYRPYPPQTTEATSSQPVNVPWYKRLFQSTAKHARSPINRVRKLPVEPGKETEPLKDPLIRLGKTIHYQDQTVIPGFYILSLKDDEQNPTLSLIREQETLLQVPAKQVSKALASSETEKSSNEELPKPPQKEGAKVKHHEEEAQGNVELSEDGQKIILVYQKGQEKFTSIPLDIVQPDCAL